MKDFESKRVGQYRLLANRAKEYIGWVQFLLIAYTSTFLTDLSLIHFLVGVPVFALLLFVDWKFVFPSFQRQLALKSPYFRDLKEAVDRIDVNTRKEVKE